MKQILVVEDEILVALDISHTLESAGFAVVGPCASLQEGLVAFDGHIPDGAVLDVQLGPEDVFPLADRLQDAGVPIVFHSGHAEADELLRRFPAASLCSKPCAPAKLAEAVSDAISRRATSLPGDRQASRG